MLNERKATVSRKTKETDITITLNLDGQGMTSINTGIGFFDHMLDAFSRHGLIDLNCVCQGDLNVDTHHSVEDTGLVLGEAIKQALGSKQGITRAGYFMMCMDEALVTCALDLSGRPAFEMDYEFKTERVGDFETAVVDEFFRSVANSCGCNLHFIIHRGVNAHHIIEAMFKAFGRALDNAIRYDERINGVMSTKGSL